MLENTPDQQSKLKTKNWVEINDDSHGTYNTISQIKFKTTMLKLSLCDYSDACRLVKGTITLVAEGAEAAAIEADENNKQAIFKDCAIFTDCITEIYNTIVDNAKNHDVLTLMYNLIEYNDNYSGTTASLLQYHKDEQKDNITYSDSFGFK